MQQLRHQHDAILVGVGTVIADNPLLTDRTGSPAAGPLARHHGLALAPAAGFACRPHGENDVVVFCSFAEEKKKQVLLDHGIQVEQVASSAWMAVPISKHLPQSGEREITSVMIEGGALVNWTALLRAWRTKFFYYAPKILAGTGSVPFAAGQGFRRMSEAAYLKWFRLHRFGEDFAVEGYLRDPYLD